MNRQRSSHPVLDVIESFLLARTQRLAQLLRKRPRLNKTPFPPDVLSWHADMEQVMEEIHAFDGWIDKPFYAKPPQKQVRLITAAFKIWEADKPTLVKAIESARRPSRGRPVRNRFLAIEALETKLLCPRLTWRQIVPRLCLCGRPEHDEDCQQALRRDVRRLRALLLSHNLSLPLSQKLR